MGTVYIGRMSGPRGFSRVVAIKRLHPHLAREERFTSMLLDEARLATRISHPHVVPILDVVEADGELLLVFEYVDGTSLSRLVSRARELEHPCPPRVAASLIAGVCRGLHAAHEAKDEGARPLGLVHRDVSPQNILVGAAGLARITDFGIAKATGRAQETATGQIKGKFSYMAPEQLDEEPLDRRVDVFGSGIVLWELLVGEPLFPHSAEPATIVAEILFGKIRPPSQRRADVPPALDAVVLRALARDPAERFGSAEEMANALAAVFGQVPTSEVVAWMSETGADELRESSELLARAESGSGERKPVAVLERGRTLLEPATVTGNLNRAPRRRSRTALGGVALALVLGVGFLAMGLRTRPSAGDRTDAVVRTSATERPEEPTPSSSPEPTPTTPAPLAVPASSAPEPAAAKRDGSRPRRANAPPPRVRTPPADRSASAPPSSAASPPAAARVLEGIPNDRTLSPASPGTPP
jgi:serine/threonine-protein kinase